MQVQLGAEWVVAVLLASAMCLCGGDRSWPQQLTLGSGQERRASLHVHLWACMPSPRRAGHSRVAYGPVLLVCTTVSPLPSVPPRWAAWQIFSLTGPAPVAALAQVRW